MNHVEFAHGSLSPAEREHRRSLERSVSNAPDWWLAGVNASRRSTGLPILRRKGGSVPQPAARRPGTPVRSSTPSKSIVRLWIVAAPGRADVVSYQRSDGSTGVRDLPEMIDRNAFDVDALSDPQGPLWDIRCAHDGRPVISSLSGRLRCQSTARAGLVISARLDPTNREHLLLAAKVRALDPAVSIGFLRRSVRRGRGMHGQDIEIVTAADLRHVAILTNGERPAYARARAFVLEGPSHEPERIRQRDLAIEMALRPQT